MPFVDLDDARLYYEDSGGDGPAVVFSHGLLLDRRMFDAQVAALRGTFRCIAYDHRGQGRSTSAPMRWIDMETCSRDAARLIDALDATPCHFVGLSMGGFVGLRLALRQPELLRSLTLLESSADPEPPENVPRYKLMNAIAKSLSIRLVAGRVQPILFGRSFLTDPERAFERKLWRERVIENARAVWPAVNGVIFRNGVYNEIDAICTPTLIAVGEEDVATIPEQSRRMHARIRGSQLEMIPRAGHSSAIENPAAVTQLLQSFLAQVDGVRV